MRPTMKMVAEAAGVSIMTVSRALRDQPVLPVATRRRIQKIAQEIGYRPDPLVSTLMAQLHGRRSMAESPVICFVTAYPDPNHWKDLPFNVESFEGASKRAEELGYVLEHFCLTEPGMTDARANRVLRARGVVGLVFPPLPQPRPERLDIRWEWFASATIGYTMSEPVLHRSQADHHNLMRLTWQSLWDLGYRRIGLALRYKDDKEVENRWTSAFCMEQFYSPPKSRVPILIEEEREYESFARWVKKEKPDAVIAEDPVLLAWLEKMGLRVPADIGFAMPTTVFRKRFPEIAGVDQRTHVQGSIAIDLVVEQLHHNTRGVPQEAKAVMVTGEWVPGATVRPMTPKK